MIKLRKAVAVACAMIVLGAAHALAHERRDVGAHELIVGWRIEPAYAGFPNGVQVIAEGPEKDNAKLQAVVIFGTRSGTRKTAAMDLEPSFEDPSDYGADIIPTRPGTYTFHVTGTFGGAKVDEAFTSGPKTFDNVHEAREAMFPVKDPSAGQLAQRAAKESGAMNRANVGFVLGIVALALSVAALSRRRR